MYKQNQQQTGKKKKKKRTTNAKIKWQFSKNDNLSKIIAKNKNSDHNKAQSQTRFVLQLRAVSAAPARKSADKSNVPCQI